MNYDFWIFYGQSLWFVMFSKCKRPTYLEFCARLILSSYTVHSASKQCYTLLPQYYINFGWVWLCVSLLSVAIRSIRSSSNSSVFTGPLYFGETLRNGNVFDFCYYVKCICGDKRVQTRFLYYIYR